jgi:hypothetical protein
MTTDATTTGSTKPWTTPLTTTESTTRDLAGLVDHHGVVDAVLRYTASLDLGDAELMESALTEDATIDLTPATTKIGLEFPVLSPRTMVVGALVGAVGPLDTSHTVSNVRTRIDGDTAELRCYVQGQHFLPGEGPDPAKTRHALLMNRYTTRLERDGDVWRIQHLSIDSAWFDGDPLVLVSQV